MEDFKTWKTFGDGKYMKAFEDRRIMVVEKDYNMLNVFRKKAEISKINSEIQRMKQELDELEKKKKDAIIETCKNGHHEMKWSTIDNGSYICIHCGSYW